MKHLLSNKIAKVEFSVFRMVFIYLLFGMGWILFSDSILSYFIADHEQLTRYSIYKGWAFIACTSILLYFLVRHKLRQQIAIETSLLISEERWKFALEGAGDGVWDWDLKTNQVFRSARWKEIYGYVDDEIEPNAMAGRAFIHPDDRAGALNDIDAYLKGRTSIFTSEFRFLCKDGTWKWTLSRGKIVETSSDGQPLRMIGTHTDITARKASEAQVIRLAHYDVVTNLPNRVLFLDRFKQEIKKALRTNQSITLLFLDLDQFKEVNDTLGHDQGDVLLKQVAERLMACVREMDTVARLGGDEFTVILNDLENQNTSERIAQQILEKLAEPFQIENELVYITTSIGISIYPLDGTEVEVLLKNADQALYAAKQFGRNRYHYFTPSMQEGALKRMRLISDLRVALKQDQFRVLYQPIVTLKTGEIHKAEALIRWQHPVHGLVSPTDFIPIAEDTGLIVEIGDWVFNMAASQVAKWRNVVPDFQISINKSPVQFRSSAKTCVDWMKHLTALNLDGNSIVVEITEGLLLDAHDTVVQQLDAFGVAGMQIAIDDFGTGYSSLAYLRKFNIDYVKIDRSFTSNIMAGSSDMALCEAIIVMAHKLGMKVIAEGIETQDQLDLLIEAGCDYGQGYWFSKPVSETEFEKIMHLN